MIAVRRFMASPSSAHRLGGAGLFPVDEQEPTWIVEFRLAWSGENLELKLFDLVPGTVPALECEVVLASGAREQHHVHHRVDGDECVVLIEMSDGPQCDGAVDRRHEGRVDGGVAVVVQTHDHPAE